MVAYPSIAIWGIGIPFILGVLLHRNKQDIERVISHMSTAHDVTISHLKQSKRKMVMQRSKSFFSKQRKQIAIVLNFMYRGYAEKHYDWEIVIFCRKFLLTMLVVWTQFMNRNTKSAILIFFLLFWFEINIKCKPYLSGVMNMLESLGLLISLIIANMGIIMWYYPDLEEFMRDSILAINSLYLTLWTLAFAYCILEKKEKFRRFIRTITGFKRRNNKSLLLLLSSSEALGNLFFCK
jgi:hypothetical protein